MKIKLTLLHFGYSEDNNTKRVYVRYFDEDKKVSMYGYVDNIFGYSHDDLNDYKFLEIEVELDVISIKFMEMEENGRTNHVEYSSVEEYFADPIVKDRCLEYYRTPSWMNPHAGNPLEVECTMVLSYNGNQIELNNRYDCEDDNTLYSFVPLEWYSEAVNINFDGEVYETAEDYLNYAHSNPTDDPLFGERYFPVFRFNKDDLVKVIDTVHWFTNYSKPIFDKDYVYFGIRSKASELSSITRVYDYGKVLKNKEWDWE